MYNILEVFGIKYQSLPGKKNLAGMLRTCATKITQIGFSKGQVIDLKAKDFKFHSATRVAR